MLKMGERRRRGTTLGSGVARLWRSYDVGESISQPFRAGLTSGAGPPGLFPI